MYRYLWYPGSAYISFIATVYVGRQDPGRTKKFKAL